MEGFTIVDAGVGVIILLSAVLAYSRGFVREVLAIGGWVAAAIAAFVFALRHSRWCSRSRSLTASLATVASFR